MPPVHQVLTIRSFFLRIGPRFGVVRNPGSVETILSSSLDDSRDGDGPRRGADPPRDATDAADRPPILERVGAGPRPGGDPGPPHPEPVLADLPEPGGPRHRVEHDPRRFLPLPRAPRLLRGRAETKDDAVHHHGQQDYSRGRDPEQEHADDSLYPARAGGPPPDVRPANPQDRDDRRGHGGRHLEDRHGPASREGPGALE